MDFCCDLNIQIGGIKKNLFVSFSSHLLTSLPFSTSHQEIQILSFLFCFSRHDFSLCNPGWPWTHGNCKVSHYAQLNKIKMSLFWSDSFPFCSERKTPQISLSYYTYGDAGKSVPTPLNSECFKSC